MQKFVYIKYIIYFCSAFERKRKINPDFLTILNITIMLLFNNLTATEKNAIVREVLASYPNLTETTFNLLVTATTTKGAKFVSIREYASAESNGTEIANHTIDVGACYDAMHNRDAIKLEDININDIDVNTFSYDNIDFNGLSLEQYKQAVRDSLPIALTELMQPKAAKDTSATVKFNAMLTYNRNTHNINLYGMSTRKNVVVEGVFKTTKKGAKTRAKEIIRKVQNLSTDKLRYFTLQNVGIIRMNGTELIFE